MKWINDNKKKMKPILDVVQGADFLSKNEMGVAAFSPEGAAFNCQDVDQAMLSIIMVFQRWEYWLLTPVISFYHV